MQDFKNLELKLKYEYNIYFKVYFYYPIKNKLMPWTVYDNIMLQVVKCITISTEIKMGLLKFVTQ